MLVIYKLLNQSWEFSFRFPFLDLTCGIAWSLTCGNLGKNLSKIKVLGNDDDYVDVST